MSDDDCPGVGKCHGCMAWCDECGNVGEVCEGPVCHSHRCLRCNALLTDDEKCFNGGTPAWCFACCISFEMHRAIDRDQDECAAGARVTAEIEAFCGRSTP